MKKSLRRPSSAMAFVLLAITCTCVQAQQAQQAQDPCATGPQTRVTFDDELRIAVNAAPYLISRKQIKKKERLFKRSIHYPRPRNLGPLEIKALAVVRTLYCEAEGLRIKNSIPKGKYITGVWMIIGMENDNVCYSFRPTVMEVGSNTGTQYVLKTKDAGDVYRYDGTQFVRDDRWEEKRDVYFDKVRIKHVRNPFTFHKRARYRNSDNSLDTTWRGDAREVFYSFQEILGFYSTHNQENTPAELYSKSIYVNHSAAKFTTKPKDWHFWRVKHNTFITVEGTPETEKERAAITTAPARNAAPGTNLAHVCPSNCDDLRYTAQ